MNELDKVMPLEDSTTPCKVSEKPENENVCEESAVATAEENAPEVADVAEAAAPEDAEDLQKDSRRYHEMSKEELVSEMRAILSEDKMGAHKEVAAIKQAFFNIRTKENLEELNAFVEAGNSADAFSTTPDELENEFKSLFAEFKDKRAAYIAADEAKRKENLEKKEAILAQLKSISEDIDNINTKFPEFQQLQQDFKAIKEIPAGAENEIWKQFQTLVEQFYDHLKMNRELRDLDFKKNLELKKALIEEAKKLEGQSDVVAAFRSLQTLHEEWRNIGPVAKELRESLWDEFKAASTVVNKRHQEYFEQRKASEQANEEAKTKICEEIEALDYSNLRAFNEWNEMTDKVIEFQKRWKEYGFASKKANNALYSRFREACDKFFNAKTEYFQKTKEEFSSNLQRKTALCEQAEALKENCEDINKATAEIVKLQAEWKKIGSVPRKQSDALWQRFQSACNYFFDERKKQNSERRHVEVSNLEAKRAIIAELKELPKDGDRKEVIAKVKELQAKWQEVGFVPFKMKDKVYAEYREVCDALYGAYNAKENKARISNFHTRIAEMKDDSRKIEKERDRLLRVYDAKKNEVQTIENNMGFFNVKSSAGNSMLKEMEKKIKRLKDEMTQIEEQIAIIDAGE